MTKKDIESKLELIETEIELINELIEFDCKNNKGLIISGLLTFICLIVVYKDVKILNMWHVFNISLFTNITYRLIFDMKDTKFKYKSELKKLMIDKMYYKSLLNENE